MFLLVPTKMGNLSSKNNPAKVPSPKKIDNSPPTYRISELYECSFCHELCTERILRCPNRHAVCAWHVGAEDLVACLECRVSYADGTSQYLLPQRRMLNNKLREKKKVVEEQSRCWLVKLFMKRPEVPARSRFVTSWSLSSSGQYLESRETMWSSTSSLAHTPPNYVHEISPTVMRLKYPSWDHATVYERPRWREYYNQ